jgi:hypothetical protein
MYVLGAWWLNTYRIAMRPYTHVGGQINEGSHQHRPEKGTANLRKWYEGKRSASSNSFIQQRR